MLYSLSLHFMDPFYQLSTRMIDVDEDFLNNQGIFYGIWTKYNPLSITQQLGPVRLMDSNCFHYQNIMGQNSERVFLIYYDCLYPETKTIQRFLTYISVNGEQFIHQVEIEPLEYENIWYFFQLLYWPSLNKLEIIMVKENQYLLHQKLDVNLINEKNLLITIGGGLTVTNSNIDSIQVGSKFSYFPGSMYFVTFGDIVAYLSPFEIDINNFYIFFDQVSEVICFENKYKKLLDKDLVWLDIQTYTSENINTDSFILDCWFRVVQINQIQDDFIYQFMQILPNFEMEQLSNQNLSPFQFFYKISPNNNKIMITTYSYNFPSVTLDFSNKDNNFLIPYEFELFHSINLWHNLFVNLISDQMQIKIVFFNEYEKFEHSTTIIVKQFRNVQYKLQYGNLQESTQNYLNVQTRNMIFYNCQQELQQQNCHYTCQDCDGPTQTDCLSCSQQSKRIYLLNHKACVCPYNYQDDYINQNCRSYTDLLFDINPIQKQIGCNFGYFQFDNQCYYCPTSITDQQITCLECLQNSKDWNQNPYCQKSVYINPNGNTARIISDNEQQYYVFNGLELQICRFCNRQSLSNIENIFEDFQSLIYGFKSFAQISKKQNQLKFDKNYHYECNIDYCGVCSINLFQLVCIKCYMAMEIRNGICIQDTLNGVPCLNPYYISSNGECKLCSIKNCKYCFEYVKNDLSQCTLYANFKKFDADEQLDIGCALCEQNYIFDFTIGQCLYKKPSLPNCLRSFINIQNQEICTLSLTDFNIAPEIINCESIIQNCLQCIFTPQSVIKCIICKSGFTSSIKLGNCYPNSHVNAKIVIDGDQQIYDAWVQRVQSFMMKFLPNQYFYQRSYIYYNIFEFQVECKDSYSFDMQRFCVKYCSSDCLNCQLKYDEYNCLTCPLNNYYQSNRNQESGQCVICTQLCDVCIERSELEIYKIQTMFKISEKNKIYSKICIKPIKNQNVLIDPIFQIARYCYDPSCNSEYKFNFYYEENPSLLYTNIDSFVNIDYCNQIGTKFLTLQIFEKEIYSNIEKNLNLTSLLKSEIFGLEVLKLVNNIKINDYLSVYVFGFDVVELNDANFIFMNQKYFKVTNQNKQFNLVLNNVVIKHSDIQNIKSLIDSESFGDIQLNSIQIIHSIFNNSSLLNFQYQQQSGKIRIQNLILQFCNFTNSQLFSFSNNQIQLSIKQLIIDQCQFVNSSFINFFTNLAEDSNLEIEGIIVTSNKFDQSYLLNSTNQLQIQIHNLVLDLNQIELSTIIGFYSNFTIIQTSINNNSFLDSQFIASYQIITMRRMHCIIENLNANDNIFLNSNLILISSSLSNYNMYFYLRQIQLKFNKRQVNDQQLVNLIKINCYHLKIENIYIINSQNLRIFYLIEITHLFAQNIVFENQMINYKVPLNLYCTDYITSENKLFLIYGYKIVNIQNIKVIKQFSVDQSLIEISSSRNISNNQQNILELIDLEFDGNLLLQQSQSNLFSLITINSEQNTHIQFQNIIFKKNVLHSQTDDSLESSTSLIYVISITGIIEINNLYCQNNALTNSSNSYIFLKSEIIKINNYSVSQHNILPLKLWKQFYDLQLEENDYIYDQEDINLIIQQSFNIKNKCGGGLITASEFYCFDCLFQDIIGERSSVFEIKTQGDGIIKLINLTIQFLDYDLSKTISSSGCITIYSSNSLLNLTIKQAIFLSIFNRMASSIFTIYPSFLNNNIHIQDVKITNCISLKNPIINLQFSLQSINFNKVIMENILISFQKENWIKYFEKTGMLSQFEMIDITRTSNALIYLENCQVIIRNIIIQGLFSCPLIKLINISRLFISQLFVEIEQFYSFNLLELIQDLKIEQTIYFQYVHFQHIKTYENINNTIFHHPKINYIVQGCIQIEDKLQKPIIYSFDSIIKLMQQTQQEISIMLLISNSNNTQFSFQNVIIKQNNCTYCQKGLIYLKIENSNKLQIRNLFCNNNYIQQFGCLNIMSTNYINQNIIIQDSNFFYNNGSSGVGISSLNLSIRIIQCKILNNIASNQGGGLYLEVKQRNFYIKESIIINNQAFEGGGIYLYEDSIINNQNFIKSFLYFNKAERFADNLVEIPTHLTLFINSYQMQSEDININNITIRSLKLKPYKIIEQGIMKQSKYLMIPSNQIVNSYQILIPQLHIQKNIFDHISIALKNSRNELQLNVQAYTCQVSQTTVKENQIQNSKLNANLKSDIHNYNFDIGSLSFHQNPYENEFNHLQILVNCSQSNTQKELLYLIKARSYKCQLGEFYVDEGCQICQSINGFYSVTYNATKCSIFDKNKFANITSNEIQLLEGYWRPHSYSDYIDACYNNMKNCQGGWKIGNDLCSIGYLGGLCEECDSNDIMGNGNFFKNKQDSQCYDCRYATNHILAIVFTSFWAIISIVITLKSIEKSKQLFNSLWMKQRFNKTLFKLNQDLEGIFIKMLLNYLWIFSVIFTFNIKFSFSFSFIDQTSNTSNFLAFSIDCILQIFSQIELIYVRIMANLFLIFIQFVIILIGYSVYTIIFGTILDILFNYILKGNIQHSLYLR
ncbi:unnamed protein product [Paramecium pentaurelia]|uniref:Transmembrane protein n=1 Tax=Paramecium pentaurelia TaxID=43138 RepID=A0A8S1TBS4_9CILI|nr:unnamed protein product [Paramecium pentaurelia]